MSLPVAIQSVLYYILSCSTCNKVIHRRKAKVRAQKDRAEKAKIEDEQPGLYRHPSPFRTNPYWDEEIALGPNFTGKKKDSKTESTKALNGNGNGNGNGSSITSTNTGSGAISLQATRTVTTATTEGTASRISGEGWNRKLYQRENEPLWGFDTPSPSQRIKDALARAGSTAGRLFELTSPNHHNSTSDEEDSDDESGNEGRGRNKARNYYLGRNPPVNDLHPPVVTTTPASRAETSWMLQPPPSAKVMEGKERVGTASLRSRADSNCSSRKMGGKGMGVQPPAVSKLRPYSRHGVKEEMTEDVKEGVGISPDLPHLPMPSPAASHTPPSKSSDSILAPEPEPPQARPKLDTILSSSTLVPQSQSQYIPAVTDENVREGHGEEGKDDGVRGKKMTE